MLRGFDEKQQLSQQQQGSERSRLEEGTVVISRAELEEMQRRIANLELTSSTNQAIPQVIPSGIPQGIAQGILKGTDKELRLENDGDDDEVVSSSTLFVSNLNESQTNIELHALLFRHFSQMGPVTKVFVTKDTQGRPYALVHFVQPGMADLMTSRMAHTNCEGKDLKLERCSGKCTLIISRIPSSLSLASFTTRLSKLGPIQDTSIISPPGLSHYVVLITYHSRITALTVMTAIRQDSDWSVTFKNEAHSSPPIKVCQDQRTITVSQLNSDLVTPALLLSHFEKYGPIELIQTHVKGNTTTATIKYSSPFASYKAVKEEHQSRGLSLLYWLR